MLSIDIGIRQLYIYDWGLQEPKIIDYEMDAHGLRKLFGQLVDLMFDKDAVIVEMPTYNFPDITYKFGKIIGLIHAVCGHFDKRMFKRVDCEEKNNKTWKSRIKELDWVYMSSLKKKKSKEGNKEYCRIVKEKMGGDFDDHNIADAWMIGIAYQREKA